MTPQRLHIVITSTPHQYPRTEEKLMERLRGDVKQNGAPITPTHTAWTGIPLTFMHYPRKWWMFWRKPKVAVYSIEHGPEIELPREGIKFAPITPSPFTHGGVTASSPDARVTGGSHSPTSPWHASRRERRYT